MHIEIPLVRFVFLRQCKRLLSAGWKVGSVSLISVNSFPLSLSLSLPPRFSDSSFPHGGFSLATAIIASIAWIFSTVALQNCNFVTPTDYLYCYQPPPAPPKYGTCGDCHCINGENPCPSDPGEIPLVDVPDPWLKQLESMEALNPYKMTCNPYNTTGGFEGNCTDPPQLEYQLELWETAACGIKYDMSTLDEDQCPTQYTMKTYDTEEELKEDGAYMVGFVNMRVVSVILCVRLLVPDSTCS